MGFMFIPKIGSITLHGSPYSSTTFFWAVESIFHLEVVYMSAQLLIWGMQNVIMVSTSAANLEWIINSLLISSYNIVCKNSIEHSYALLTTAVNVWKAGHWYLINFE